MNNNSTLLPIGTVLSHDRYKIDRYVASGGFGNTYEATDLTFNERVAIKELFVRGMCERNGNDNTISTIEENAQAFSSIMGKFKKEALRLRQIHHANIVAVRDLFEENGTAYYVMDFLEGESLASRLQKQRRPFTEDEFNALFPDILSALDCVHKQGIWHLDIKPANIMLDKDNHPYLIDFGASKQVRNSEGQTMSTSSSIVLTPGFAPTEQMEQNIDKFGPWTDFYALGATIYFCLTLQVPPLPSDIAENADKALNLPDSLSAKMKSLIKWLMEPNRTKRPQSVDEITEWLNGATNKNVKDSLETVVANNKIVIPVNTDHKVNRKIYAYICGAILVLFIVGGGIYAYRNVANSTEQNTNTGLVLLEPNNEHLKNVYNMLKENDDTKAKTFEEFSKWMCGSKYRLNVYAFLKRQGVQDIGTYPEFCKLIGFGTANQRKANTNFAYIPDFSNLWKTYHYLIENGYDNMTYGEFFKKMNTSAFRDEAFGSLRRSGYDIPSYEEFCIYNGYCTDQQHKDRRKSKLYYFVKENNLCSITDKDVFIAKLTDTKFEEEIYNKLKSLDIYGIGNSLEEFQDILLGNTSVKRTNTDYIKNAEDVYSILVIDANYNSPKEKFIEDVTIQDNYKFQKKIYKLLVSVHNEKYNSFQDFQAAMHPGILE